MPLVTVPFVTAVPTTFKALPAFTGLAWQNFNALARSGFLQFSIMQKIYYQESPLYRFPQRSSVAGNNAIGASDPAVGVLITEEAHTEGLRVRFDPGYGIATNVNFGVRISWAAPVVMQSSFRPDSRIGVVLNGWLFRAAQ